MGKLFSIDAGTKSTIQDALDDLITEFGRECRLVYPAVWAACPNCMYDAIGQKSTNRWRTGGPMPFANGTTCPICTGTGKKASEETDTVTLKLEWEPSKFWYPVPGADIRVPGSICQTKGYVSDLPKVLRCDHVILDVNLQPVISTTFRMIKTPISPGNIIQDRYFVCTWELA